MIKTCMIVLTSTETAVELVTNLGVQFRTGHYDLNVSRKRLAYSRIKQVHVQMDPDSRIGTSGSFHRTLGLI